jgi:hypothetical protein
MTLADEAERGATLSLSVPRQSIGTFRVLVYGTPAKLVDGSLPVTFELRNTATAETARVGSVFMGPAR